MKEQSTDHPQSAIDRSERALPHARSADSRPAATREPSSPDSRARRARKALNGVISDETRALLLRQLFGALVELGDLEEARTVALERCELTALREVARHDLGCICGAMGEHREAAAQHRTAARLGPPDRRSFHLWCTAVSEQFGSRLEVARSTLQRARRWSTRDKLLLDTQGVYFALLAGEVPSDLGSTLGVLRSIPADERKYRGYLYGMIAHEIGDHRTSLTVLKHWLRVQASAPPRKALALAEELRRARRIVACA